MLQVPRQCGVTSCILFAFWLSHLSVEMLLREEMFA